MNLKSKKGFTLVELIIVIAILGIIALIAVPSLTGIQQRSQVNADIRTAEQIGKAVRIWLTDTGAGIDRLALINTAWVDLDSNTLTGLGDYISTSYAPKSWTGTGDAEYFIKASRPDGVNSGVDYRVMVGIGTTSFAAEEAYTAGDAAGVAFIEGASDLTAGITTMFGE